MTQNVRAAEQFELLGDRGLSLRPLYEGLGILGESGRRAILYHLAERGLSEEEIPSRISDFVAMIREIFGMGARVIEAEVERRLRASKDPALHEWQMVTARAL